MSRRQSSQVANPSGGGSSTYPRAAAQKRASNSGSLQSMTSWNRTAIAHSDRLSSGPGGLSMPPDPDHLRAATPNKIAMSSPRTGAVPEQRETPFGLVGAAGGHGNPAGRREQVGRIKTGAHGAVGLRADKQPGCGR